MFFSSFTCKKKNKITAFADVGQRGSDRAAALSQRGGCTGALKVQNVGWSLWWVLWSLKHCARVVHLKAQMQ